MLLNTRINQITESDLMKDFNGSRGLLIQLIYRINIGFYEPKTLKNKGRDLLGANYSHKAFTFDDIPDGISDPHAGCKGYALQMKKTKSFIQIH